MPDSNDPTVTAVSQIATAVAMFVATKGWIDQSTALALAGALVTIGIGIWRVRVKTKNAILASAATRLDPTKVNERIVVDKATADAIPSEKVVAQ